jgi:hypothetical protein
MKATVSNSITRNPTIRASLLLLAGLVLLIAGSAGRGQVLYSEEDAITIGGDVDRAKLRGAAQTLIETGDDLPSLEIILSHTKPKVVEAIPGNASYTFEDPDKSRAYEALHGHWYSIDFLERALRDGGSMAGNWALRMIFWQEGNVPRRGEDSHEPRALEMTARHGTVTPAFLNRLIPTLERLRNSPDEGLRNRVDDFIERHGLLVDRQKLLDVLKRADARTAEQALRAQIGRLRINPGIAPEIWELLLQSSDHQLIVTSLRYRWLFNLETLPEENLRFLEKKLATDQDGIWTNANSAIARLAISDNPLAPQILRSLSESEYPLVRKYAAGYLSLYAKTHREPHHAITDPLEWCGHKPDFGESK